MKITITSPRDSARNILRRAGYSEYVDRNTHKTSYAKRLGSDLFPKFHCYANETAGSVSFDLHIDQKHVSYEGSSMHLGEYEGANIERELARIRAVADAMEAPEPPKKPGFFASIFGSDE